MKKIILASTSPRRKSLLEQAGLEFEVISSDCDENCSRENPAEYVEELSLRKCRAGLNKAEEMGKADMLVIGSDTVVAYKDKILEKPADRDDAFRMLKELSGNEHYVYTGVTVIDSQSGKTQTFHEKTCVKFYDISDDEIYAYIDCGEPMDKAGAYGIQGRGVFLVEKIEGDYNNVVGLPVARLMQLMKKSGYLE